MAYFILNFLPNQAASAAPADLLRAGLSGVDTDEPHRDAFTAGDLVLVYLGAPDRIFVARAELASAVHPSTPSEARAYPGGSSSGVALAQVEEWDPPVPRGRSRAASSGLIRHISSSPDRPVACSAPRALERRGCEVTYTGSPRGGLPPRQRHSPSLRPSWPKACHAITPTITIEMAAMMYCGFTPAR